MIILSGSATLLDEYEPDILITTSIKGYNFEVPYTFFFDGLRVFIYQYNELKYTIERKTDIKIEKKILRILIGSEIGIPENYIKLPPDLFVCFEKTYYPSKFFYRKAQMWIGSQISSTKLLGHIIFNGVTNRVLFSPEGKENGVLFEGTTYLILDDELLSTSKMNSRGEKNENNRQ
ncbi:MAG: hypothetical protein N2Z58_03685 [Fervidobacterium sp.]|nr:hypothetical protein [Fervidobacterium sp.]